jgi:hypothetical protein
LKIKDEFMKIIDLDRIKFLMRSRDRLKSMLETKNLDKGEQENVDSGTGQKPSASHIHGSV